MEDHIFVLSKEVGKSVSHGKNGDVRKENVKLGAGRDDFDDTYCNVVDDSDMICEEVVAESITTKSNGVKQRCVKADNEVICIDDSEDETSCSNGIKAIEDFFDKPSSFSSKNGTAPKDASSDSMSFCGTSASIPLIDRVLYDIGFNLIVCKFFPKNENHTSDHLRNSVDHLIVPLTYCKCGFKSETTLVLKSHVNLLDGIPLKCCTCKNFAAKNLKRLAVHMREQHGVPERWTDEYPSYQCHFCEHDAVTLAALKRHARSCTSRFTLNTNLAPRSEAEEAQSLLPEGRPGADRSVSVIYPNPNSVCTPQNNQHSVIVTNAKRTETIPGGSQCGYCKASVTDLQSLGVHMELVHNIRYSFDSPKSGEVATEDAPTTATTVASEDEAAPTSDESRRPEIRPPPIRADVERELAKMAVRRECLWCYRKFESLDAFEEHVVLVHDDLNCDASGFWPAVESGLAECSGSEIAALLACPWCLESFQSTSSCHRHLLNCHWSLHLEDCKWCRKVVAPDSPYSKGAVEMDDADDGDNTSSSSSFLSDIDSRERS